MGTSRRLHFAATLIDRLPRVASSRFLSAFLSRFPLCILAGLVLTCPFAAAADSDAAFIYPTGGESFYTLDYVNVTYQSTFASPSLYTFCSINGVTQQIHVQDAEPDNGSVLVHINVTTNVPCWFELSPGQVAGEAAFSEKWTVLARTGQQTTWSATAAATSTPTSNTVAMASTTTSDKATSQTSRTESSHGLSSGAKIGIAVAVALAIIALFTTGVGLWWRRRHKREVAKDMVNFVDGDIVTLMDGGRFEKTTKPPHTYYDPYLGASSQSSISPSHTPGSIHHSAPPAEQQQQQQQYYDPPPVQRPASPSIQPQTMLPQPAITNGNAASSGLGRHPWSPPDYEAHSPMPSWYDQTEGNFYAAPRQSPSSTSREVIAAHPVEALPAILPEMKPQAELPAREGYHGNGDEQELPVPQQAPPSRHAPPNGLEIEEQKFLLADIMPLRQKRSQPGGPGPAG